MTDSTSTRKNRKKNTTWTGLLYQVDVVHGQIIIGNGYIVQRYDGAQYTVLMNNVGVELEVGWYHLKVSEEPARLCVVPKGIQ